MPAGTTIRYMRLAWMILHLLVFTRVSRVLQKQLRVQSRRQSLWSGSRGEMPGGPHVPRPE